MIGDCLSRSFGQLSDRFCQGVREVEDALLSALFPAGPSQGGLSEEDIQRIRESLWRIRRDLDQLEVTHFVDDVSSLLDDAFGGPEAFVRTVRAWADLVDTLVTEAEKDYGSAAGRGLYKKRHVKAALLYLVRRSGMQIPDIPAFVGPFAWDALLDPVVDLLAQFSNRHKLWKGVPPAPTFRARINAGAQRAGGWLESIVRWLTDRSWSVVFYFSPVSPRLQAAVDGFLLADPQPVRTVLVLARWTVQHTGTLVVLSDLFSTALIEAHFVEHADPDQAARLCPRGRSGFHRRRDRTTRSEQFEFSSTLNGYRLGARDRRHAL